MSIYSQFAGFIVTIAIELHNNPIEQINVQELIIGPGCTTASDVRRVAVACVNAEGQALYPVEIDGITKYATGPNASEANLYWVESIKAVRASELYLLNAYFTPQPYEELLELSDMIIEDSFDAA